MNSVEEAESIDVGSVADAIREVGFECTDCGDCCTSEEGDHVVTVFPNEIQEISAEHDLERDEVAEPMPFGQEETFEWTLKRDACGDCFFYEGDHEDTETDPDEKEGGCGIYEQRPRICRTYPFDVKSVDEKLEGVEGDTETLDLGDGNQLVVYECEGTGTEISEETALELAEELLERKVDEARESEEILANYSPVEPPEGHVVVHDSEGSHVVEK